MIRFVPDTWLEAFLRFFIMIAPDAHLYVEISAPDIRLALMLLLAVAVLVVRWRSAPAPGGLLALLLLVLLSTVPWLYTSGNGRYWIPMLMAAGPVLAGLIWLLRGTVSFRLMLLGLVVGLQCFLLGQSTPWNAWSYLTWREPPYFQLDVPPQPSPQTPVTYVTLTSISYSLIAPQFPASSRWVNITAGGSAGRDADWTRQFLERSVTLRLVLPSIPGQSMDGGRPSAEFRATVDDMLGARALALDPAQPCSFSPSRGLAAMQRRLGSEAGAVQSGFWICPLVFPAEAGTALTTHVARTPPQRVLAVMDKVEAACPRFFPAGLQKPTALSDGWLKQYPASDMRLYVMDNGEVLYRYIRAVNPELIGTVDQLLDGSRSPDCKHIRGRSGLPWEREI